MINDLDEIRKHLGIQIAERELNHYTLLGLNRNASTNEIKLALRSVVNSWNQSEAKSDVAASQSVAKWIKQAQTTLLDESKRQEYDASLIRSKSSPASSFFPDADPFAPFDPKECLAGAAASPVAMSFGSPNDRWSELTRRIPSLLHPPTDSSDYTTPAIVRAPSTQLEYSSAKQGSAAISRIEQLKRKRQFAQRAYLIGFLLVAMAFLGYAGIRFALNRMQIAQNLDADSREPKAVIDPAKPNKPQDKTPKTIGGTLAPQGASDTSHMVLPTLRREEAADGVPKEYTDSNPFGVTPNNPATMPPNSMTPNNMATKPETPATAEPTMSTPLPTPPLPTPTLTAPTTESKPMESAKPMKPASVPANASPKAEWIAAMKGAREAVNNANFKLFEEQIKVALPLSGNKDMEDQRARLDQLGQLYRIFIKAVQDAKSKMKGAETITVGRNAISIVEINADELIVRAAGSNQRYRWDRLPPGIAEAMADFSLSDQDPTDLAARAVYFSLSPARNELYAKKIQGWFEKSVGKGDIRKDLAQALSDKYE